MRIIIPLIFSVLSIHSVFAVDNQAKTWLGIFGKKAVTTDLSFWHELQLRYDLESTTMQQLLTRFGLLKSFTANHEAGLIMGYIQTGSVKEYRPTLQHTYSLNLDEKSRMGFRSRLEWRSIENDTDHSMRYRLQPSFRYPITEKVYFLTWNEFFLNLSRETWTGNRIFERNRFFIGTRIEGLSDRIEFGYMNQYIPRDTQITSEHIITLYYFY